MILWIHPEATREAQEAYDYYYEREPRAAEGFADALWKATRRVLAAPLESPRYRAGTRRALLNRFPYQVIFRLTPERIEILAVAHTARRAYWLRRLDP